jgi:hypothetical protein
LFVKHLEEDVASSIIRVAGSTPAIGTEAAPVKSPFLISVKGDTHSLKPNNVFCRPLGQDPDSLATTQAVPSNEGILGEILRGIFLAKRGVEATLGYRRISPQRMKFGD